MVSGRSFIKKRLLTGTRSGAFGIIRSSSTILTDGTSGRITGAHLPGCYADDIINDFAPVIRTGATPADLQERAWASPTEGYNINRVG